MRSNKGDLEMWVPAEKQVVAVPTLYTKEFYKSFKLQTFNTIFQ